MSTKYKSSKDVPLNVITARLEELVDAIIRPGEFNDNEFTMRIPAECDRDADLVISEAGRRLNAIQAQVSKLELEEEGAKEAFAVVADSNELLRAQVSKMDSALNLMRHELDRARHAESNKACLGRHFGGSV